MNTSPQNVPRILINYGNGREVLTYMSHTGWEETPADFLWWSKSPLATERIRELLPHANVLESQTRYLSNLIPPYPLDKVVAELCDESRLQAASSVFPEEWINYTLRWDRARAAQLGCPLDNIYSLLAAVHLAEAVRVLSLSQPDLLLIRGGNLISDAALGVVAKAFDIPTLYTERGAFPESLFLSPTLIGPEMVAEQDHALKNWNFRDDIEPSDQFIQHYMNHDQSAWMQPQRENADTLRQRWGIPHDHRIVFYAAQRPVDANMLLNSPHFSSNKQFISYILDTLNGVEKTALVIKPHPKEPPHADAEIHQALEAAKQKGILAICDRDINVKDAIQLSSVVVSINSTTGLEALLYAVPVVVGGEAYYSHLGYTFDVASATSPTEQERLRNFLRNPTYTLDLQKDFRRFICQFNARHQFYTKISEGQNTPDDYLQAIIDTASTNKNRMIVNYTVLCAANDLLQEFSALTNLFTTDSIQLIKGHLRHKWLTRKSSI